MSMNFWQCVCTWMRFQSGQRLFTAKAMLLITESHGISAWPWNTTPRSSDGPATSRPSMITTPSEARSRPARMLRIVVLPQPEWPTMQTNSPFSIVKFTRSKTATPL